MPITIEDFEGLPDSVKADYELSGEQYVTVDSLKVTGLKTSLNSLDAKMKESQTAAELSKEEAVKEARETALEEAHKKNDSAEIIRLEREKFDDELNRRLAEKEEEVTKGFTVKQAEDALSADIKLLAAEYAVRESSKPILELVLSQKMKLDENGKRNYFGDDGSALSITDLKAFGEEFSKSPAVADLVKGEQPSNGGLAEGGSGGSASQSANDTQSRLKLRLQKRGMSK